MTTRFSWYTYCSKYNHFLMLRILNTCYNFWSSYVELYRFFETQTVKVKSLLLLWKPRSWLSLVLSQFKKLLTSSIDNWIVSLHQKRWSYVIVLLIVTVRFFYRATRMRSADYVYAVARRPFVCHTHAGILSKRLYLSSKFFHRRVAPPFYFFHTKRGRQYSDVP